MGKAEMLSSVRCGLAAMPPDCEAVLSVLGDQPTLTGELVPRLVLTFQTSAAAWCAGRGCGPAWSPALVAMSYRDEGAPGLR